MKMRLITLSAAAVALALFSTGCSIFESKGDQQPNDAFYRPMDKAGKNGKQGAGDADFNDPKGNSPSAFTEGSGLSNDTYDGFGTRINGVTFDIVYFQFDQSTISSSEMSKIDKVISYLNSNPGTGVVIEGNCDVRGSEEYNRALGERRAIAAQEHILASGIPANRIKTISNGKVKPVDMGEGESAHKKNRRDEFVPVKLLHP